MSWFGDSNRLSELRDELESSRNETSIGSDGCLDPFENKTTRDYYIGL